MRGALLLCLEELAARGRSGTRRVVGRQAGWYSACKGCRNRAMLPARFWRPDLHAFDISCTCAGAGQALEKNGWLYDSTLPERYYSTSPTSPSVGKMLWPYTMDYGIPQVLLYRFGAALLLYLCAVARGDAALRGSAAHLLCRLTCSQLPPLRTARGTARCAPHDPAHSTRFPTCWYRGAGVQLLGRRGRQVHRRREVSRAVGGAALLPAGRRQAVWRQW